MYDPVKNQVTTSRDVVVMESAVTGEMPITTDTKWCVEEKLPVPVVNDRSVGKIAIPNNQNWILRKALTVSHHS